MKKWLIVAYPEYAGGYLPRQEKEIYAETHAEAERIGFRLFPQYHEVGAYEVEEEK